MKTAILDCYTVEPSGLGVPPFMSSYVRNSFDVLVALDPTSTPSYITIDDLRTTLESPTIPTQTTRTNPRQYSLTRNCERALQILSEAEVVVVIAGDAVPSRHLHAENGSPGEIARAMATVRGKRVLLGPMAGSEWSALAELKSVFDARHVQTLLPSNIYSGSSTPANYEAIRTNRDSYVALVDQIGWTPIAELELYRGCTRRRYCSFCNEPSKSPSVDFRSVDDVIDEAKRLYRAGIRNFRMGQQTCFFSYHNRDVEKIERLLSTLRTDLPDIDVLHIDNADPLAVASKAGRRIAALVAEYCTEGNCAPMGIESFDQAVVERNALTCTPTVLRRAIEHVNEFGQTRGPNGTPLLLPGLNIIYGLAGETHRTHYENLQNLVSILDSGLQCHRTNVRAARAYAGTPFASMQSNDHPDLSEQYTSWKADIRNIYDRPMKQRVYPEGLHLKKLHAFFNDERGAWHRRLGSYSVQVLELGAERERYSPSSLVVSDHDGRYVIGRADEDVRRTDQAAA